MTTVVCELCPRYCAIPDGGAGDCRIRVNLKGRLIATTFGRPSSVHIDPMEKKTAVSFFPRNPHFFSRYGWLQPPLPQLSKLATIPAWRRGNGGNLSCPARNDCGHGPG